MYKTFIAIVKNMGGNSYKVSYFLDEINLFYTEHFNLSVAYYICYEISLNSFI